MVSILFFVFIQSKLNRQSCPLVDESTSCKGRPGGLETDSPQMRALDIAARFIERRTSNLDPQNVGSDHIPEPDVGSPVHVWTEVLRGACAVAPAERP